MNLWKSHCQSVKKNSVESPEPTAEPTTEPTAGPTTEPTAEPTAEPTTEPTAEPTAEPATPAIDNSPVIIDNGHLDFRALVAQQELIPVIGDDSRTYENKSVLRNPDSVTIKVSRRALATRSSAQNGKQWDFLGSEGTQFSLLPQTQVPGLPWPGFSTEKLDYARYPQGINTSLRPIEVPTSGRAFFFELAGIGENSIPVMHFDSGDKSKFVMTTHQPTHMHGNWVFTQPGTYKFVLSFSPALNMERVAPITRIVTFLVEGDTELSTPEPTPETTTPEPTPETTTPEPTPSATPEPTPSATPEPTPSATSKTPVAGTKLASTGFSGHSWLWGALLLLGLPLLAIATRRNRLE